MAWTAPRTWTDGELVTAAIMNPHIRDNQLAGGPHLIARKGSNEDVTTTTLQDDNDFTFAVAANEVWQVYLSLLIVTGAGAMKSAFSFPASGEMTYTMVGNDIGSVLVQQSRQTASDTPAVTYIASSTGRLYTIDGVYVNAGTAGNVVFRNALNSASGTSTVEAQSTLWAVKLA